MKSHNKIHWKQEENDLLIKLYSQKSLTTDKIAAIYFKGKSGDAIRKRAKRLGIKRYTGKNHKKSYLKYRFEILEKNNFRCAYCGRTANVATLQIDHKIPLKLGGTNNKENLTVACWECNIGKKDKLLEIHNTKKEA